MNEDNQGNPSKEVITTIGEIIKVAGDNPDAKAAGNELGKTAHTLTKTIKEFGDSILI